MSPMLIADELVSVQPMGDDFSNEHNEYEETWSMHHCTKECLEPHTIHTFGQGWSEVIECAGEGTIHKRRSPIHTDSPGTIFMSTILSFKVDNPEYSDALKQLEKYNESS